MSNARNMTPSFTVGATKSSVTPVSIKVDQAQLEKSTEESTASKISRHNTTFSTAHGPLFPSQAPSSTES